MAGASTLAHAAAQRSRVAWSGTGLWPVDRLSAGCLLGLSVLVALKYAQIEASGAILAALALGLALLMAYAFLPGLPGARAFRCWYPLPCTFACYRVVSLVIPALWPSVRTFFFDARLAAWDHALWGVHPTVWLERLQTPALTEALQFCYSFWLPVVLLPAAVFYARRRWEEYRGYAFLLTLGFLVSYIGYLLAPARGPRFYLDVLQTQPLTGLWLCAPLRSLLDWCESAHYDCFPSGHLEMTLLAWWWTRRNWPSMSWLYVAYTLALLGATVYLRYHYTADLAAGAAAAVLVIVAAPRLERTWSAERGRGEGF